MNGNRYFISNSPIILLSKKLVNLPRNARGYVLVILETINSVYMAFLYHFYIKRNEGTRFFRLRKKCRFPMEIVNVYIFFNTTSNF